MDTAFFARLATSGKAFKAAVPRQTLASGKYLNFMLFCPSAGNTTVYLADLFTEADEQIWGHVRTGVPTITGTPTGGTAVNLLIGTTKAAVATISWSLNGTLPWAGNLYESHRRGAQRLPGQTQESGSHFTDPLILAAGSAIVACYGPAAATLSIAVAASWGEQ